MPRGQYERKPKAAAPVTTPEPVDTGISPSSLDRVEAMYGVKLDSEAEVEKLSDKFDEIQAAIIAERQAVEPLNARIAELEAIDRDNEAEIARLRSELEKALEAVDAAKDAPAIVPEGVFPGSRVAIVGKGGGDSSLTLFDAFGKAYAFERQEIEDHGLYRYVRITQNHEETENIRKYVFNYGKQNKGWFVEISQVRESDLAELKRKEEERAAELAAATAAALATINEFRRANGMHPVSTVEDHENCPLRKAFSANNVVLYEQSLDKAREEKDPDKIKDALLREYRQRSHEQLTQEFNRLQDAELNPPKGLPPNLERKCRLEVLDEMLKTLNAVANARLRGAA